MPIHRPQSRLAAAKGDKLQHRPSGHRSHRFGPSSQSIGQLRPALETRATAVAGMAARLRLPETRWTSRDALDQPKPRPIPGRTPRQKIGLTTGDDDCAHCGGTLRRPGEDVTAELKQVPRSRGSKTDRCRAAGRFVVNRIVNRVVNRIVNRIMRPRFARAGCEALTQAALPSRPVERGRAPGLHAHAPVNRHAPPGTLAMPGPCRAADRLPLDRQSRIFERDGLDPDRSALADRVGTSAAPMESPADAIGRHVPAGRAIFADGEP